MHEKRPKMDHHKVISEHESIKLTKSEALNDSKLVDRYSSWPVWTSCVGYLAAKYYSYPRSRSDYKKRTSSGIAPSRIFCTRKLWTRSICRNFFSVFSVSMSVFWNHGAYRLHDAWNASFHFQKGQRSALDVWAFVSSQPNSLNLSRSHMSNKQSFTYRYALPFT